MVSILTNHIHDRNMEARNAIDALPGHLIFWGVSLAVMLADDVAMLAFMFC